MPCWRGAMSSGRAGKQFVSQDSVVEVARELLADIQRSLLEDATRFRDAHIQDARDYDELRAIVADGGWGARLVGWLDDEELAVKDETGATIRCFPFDQPGEAGACVISGRAAERVALFAKAY